MTTCNSKISSVCLPSESTGFRSLQKEQGFTLIEMAAVVVVIGILVSFTVGNLRRVTIKSKDSEAKYTLATLHDLEAAFQHEYGRYTSNLDSLGYRNTPLKYWTGPAFLSITETSYYATLIEKGDIDMDKYYNLTRWAVTQDSREPFVLGRIGGCWGG